MKRDPNNIVRALHAIQAGMATRAASRDFGIPETTLRRHLGINRRSATTTPVEEIEVDVVTDQGSSSTDILIASMPIQQQAQVASTSTDNTQQIALVSTEDNTQPTISNFFVTSVGAKPVRICLFVFYPLANCNFFAFNF